MYKSISYFFLFLLLSIVTYNASATNWYVSNVSGNDANAGTIGLPYKTIAKGISSCVPGDVVNIKGDGESYAESVNVNKDNITIQGWYSTSKPNLNGSTVGTKIGFDINADAVTISAINIINFNSTLNAAIGAGINTASGKNKLVFSSLSIDNCNFGVRNIGSGDVQILNSSFSSSSGTGFPSFSDLSGGNAIYSANDITNGPVDGNVYTGNTFYKTQGTAVIFNGGSRTVAGSKINNNNFYLIGNNNYCGINIISTVNNLDLIGNYFYKFSGTDMVSYINIDGSAAENQDINISANNFTDPSTRYHIRTSGAFSGTTLFSYFMNNTFTNNFYTVINLSPSKNIPNSPDGYKYIFADPAFTISKAVAGDIIDLNGSMSASTFTVTVNNLFFKSSTGNLSFNTLNLSNNITTRLTTSSVVRGCTLGTNTRLQLTSNSYFMNGITAPSDFTGFVDIAQGTVLTYNLGATTGFLPIGTNNLFAGIKITTATSSVFSLTPVAANPTTFAGKGDATKAANLYWYFINGSFNGNSYSSSLLNVTNITFYLDATTPVGSGFTFTNPNAFPAEGMAGSWTSYRTLTSTPTLSNGVYSISSNINGSFGTGAVFGLFTGTNDNALVSAPTNAASLMFRDVSDNSIQVQFNNVNVGSGNYTLILAEESPNAPAGIPVEGSGASSFFTLAGNGGTTDWSSAASFSGAPNTKIIYFNTNLSGGQQTLNLTNLKPGTNYSFTIYTGFGSVSLMRYNYNLSGANRVRPTQSRATIAVDYSPNLNSYAYCGKTPSLRFYFEGTGPYNVKYVDNVSVKSLSGLSNNGSGYYPYQINLIVPSDFGLIFGRDGFGNMIKPFSAGIGSAGPTLNRVIGTVHIDPLWTDINVAYTGSGTYTGMANWSMTECEGNSLTLNASATGYPVPTFNRWEVSTNGGAGWSTISGAGASYNFTATPADNGKQYRPIFNTNNSNPACQTGEKIGPVGTLTVYYTTITESYNSVNYNNNFGITICEHNPITIGSVAISNPSPTFKRWEYMAYGSSTWTTESGATATFTMSDPTNAAYDKRVYRSVWSYPALCAASQEKYGQLVTLDVRKIITFTTQPSATYNICQNGNQTITANSDGGSCNTSASLQWYYSIDNGNSWSMLASSLPGIGSITGQLGYSLQLNNIATSADNYKFKLLVSCVCTAYSNVATLKVDYQPNVTSSPVNVDKCITENTFFSVDGTGTFNTDYRIQWLYSSDGGTGWANVPSSFGATTVTGSNDKTLNLTNLIGSLNGYKFKAVLTGKYAICTPSTSNIATLVVNTPPTVSAHPQSVRQCEGTTVVLTADWVGAVCSSQLIYWEQKLNGNSWTSIPTSNSRTLTLTNVNYALQHLAQYRATLMCGTSCAGVTTNAATITIDKPLTSNLSPITQTVCQYTNDNFIASFNAPTSTINNIYWQYRTSPTGNWTTIVSGSNSIGALITNNLTSGSSTLNFSSMLLSNNGYQFRAWGAGGTCPDVVSSGIATVTVIQQPAIPNMPTTDLIRATSFKINWGSAWVEGSDYYDVNVVDAGQYNQTFRVNAPTTFYQYTDGTLNKNTTYIIKVRAGNNTCGTTAWSTTATVTTNNPTITFSNEGNNKTITGLSFGDTEDGFCAQEQAFNVIGTQIESNIVFTAPTDFQIKIDGGTYASTATATITGNGPASVMQKIWVKFCPTIPARYYSSPITDVSIYSNNPNFTIDARGTLTRPTANVHDLTFQNDNSGSIQIYGTNGNGGNRLIVLAVGGPVAWEPQQYLYYTSNLGTNLNTATPISNKQGYNEYVVSFGANTYTSGAPLTITGVPAGTVLWVKAWEYNENGTETGYYPPTSQTFSAVRNPNQPLYLEFTGTYGIMPNNSVYPVSVISKDRAHTTTNANASVPLSVTAGNSTCNTGTYSNNTTTIASGGNSASLATFMWNYNVNGCTSSGVNLMSSSTNPDYLPYYSPTFGMVHQTEPSQDYNVRITYLGCNAGLPSVKVEVRNLGTGANRLIVAKQDYSPDLPSDGQWYVGSSTFGNGTQLGTGTYAIQSASSSSCNVYGLALNTKYYYRAYAYNGDISSFNTSGFATTNYNTAQASFNPQTFRTPSACKSAEEGIYLECYGLNAVSANKVVNTNWITQYEKNILGYELYRADVSQQIDGKLKFVKVADYISNLNMVASNSENGSSYSFIDRDNSLVVGNDYVYRLNYVGFDGESVELSQKMVTVFNNGGNAGLWISEINPNPATNNVNFTLKLQNEVQVSIDLIDVSGKSVMKPYNDVTFTNGEHTMSIPLNNISSGTYIMSIIAGNEVFFQKFVVVK
ncbi:MAG: T9SS type A sorting domain-containing protein [Candidatus Kapabacteria bacterium]|nr:T9SS type A sorting domain-containing protein [Candidatus Kapabacteria bacterium]